jgi:hypothetical protein
MTDNSFPITPPPKLVKKWIKSARYREFMPYPEGYEQYEQRLTTIAARWGADQELEACCEWLDRGFGDVGNFPATLRAARRPRPTPPRLKEQALAVIENCLVCDHLSPQDEAIIRRALEQLDD